MASNIQKTRPVQLGRRLGGPVVLMIAQLSKCILWFLIGNSGFAYSVTYLAALELFIAFLILNKWKISWLVLVTACASELVASLLMIGITLTHLMTATMGFSLILIISLFQLVAAFTKEVRVHYLGGQPPPFKPTYAGPPPEPEF